MNYKVEIFSDAFSLQRAVETIQENRAILQILVVPAFQSQYITQPTQFVLVTHVRPGYEV